MIASLLFVSSTAFASEGLDANSLKYFAYFLAVGIAALGGTLSQSRAAAASLEGIGRNPSAAEKIVTPMLLAMAFMESLVIFTLASIFFI